MPSETILVVDDDRKILESVGVALETAGYDIEYAFDGEEALEKLAHVTPDLVLVDIFMPFLGGLELCDRLREDRQTRGVPILAMSGLSEFASGEPRKDLQADDFIHKPLNTGELLRKVRALLERRGGRPRVNGGTTR